MKNLKTFSMMFAAIVLVSGATAHAQSYRAPNSAPARTFLGLPVPQQWSGSTPTALNRNTGYAANPAIRQGDLNSAPFANGQCSTRSNAARYGASAGCANGRCATGTCTNCNCPAGACVNGLCASGQCAACENGQCVGCANGQCANGQCGNGQMATGSCPNGRCPQNQYPAVRSNSGVNYGVGANWAPRTTRSNAADPFRRAEMGNANDDWVPRAAAGTLNNVINPSRYNQEDLDLRRPYFNNQSGELNDNRSGDTSSVSRDIRAPRPSDRSMFGAPVERAAGFAQI